MNPADLPIDLTSFNITPSSVISGILFGLIGMWLYRQGKYKENLKLKIIAIVLMVYPYFTSGPLADWGVGIVLCAAAYHYWNE